MNFFDLFILAIISLSVVLSFFRGVLSEIVSLLSWLVAFWCAQQFSVNLANLLPIALSHSGGKIAIAFIIIFLTVRIAMVLLQSLLNVLVKATGLSFINRGLGVVFGFARGLLLVTVFVFLAGFSRVAKNSNWHESILIPPFEQIVLLIKNYLPEDIAKNLNYPDTQRVINLPINIFDRLIN